MGPFPFSFFRTKRLRWILVWAIASVSPLCLAQAARASELWATDSGNRNPIELNQLSVSTGARGLISRVPHGGTITSDVLDLASDPLHASSMVWGLQLTNRIEGEKSLVAMDPYREVMISSTKLIGGTAIETLALDPTDGTFYGASSTTLFTIDPVLGGVTPVGALSHDVSFGLAFDLAGNLYGTSPGGEFVAVDKQLASSSILGLTSTPLVDLAARPEDGVMYGLGRNGILYKVDLQSGALTEVGRAIFRGSSLAFSVVPEPSTWGLLAVGMLGLALRRMAHSACPVRNRNGG